MSSSVNPAGPGETSPQSSSPLALPRRAFGHGGKRVRNADRSVYEKTDFHRQPHPTALKRITWQDVLSGPFKDLPNAERRKVANHIRSTARNLAQLLVVNNSTPPVYRDNETCTVAEPPWVPDFFESERDWKPSVPKDQMASYLASRFPDLLTSVKDGKGGTVTTKHPWVPQLILQNAYQRYARGVRLFYNREVASQETYSFGDIISGALKSFGASSTRPWNITGNMGGGNIGEEPPGLSQLQLQEMLLLHPPKQELRLKRTIALKQEESEGIDQVSSSSPHTERTMTVSSDHGTFITGSISPQVSFAYVKAEPDSEVVLGFYPRVTQRLNSPHGPLWPEDPED